MGAKIRLFLETKKAYFVKNRPICVVEYKLFSNNFSSSFSSNFFNYNRVGRSSNFFNYNFFNCRSSFFFGSSFSFFSTARCESNSNSGSHEKN